MAFRLRDRGARRRIPRHVAPGGGRSRTLTSRISGCAGGGALAHPRHAHAQPRGKVPRIGFLGNSTEALEANPVGPFREGLRERGYVEGQNLTIEYRWAEGQYERLPALVAELIAVLVAVIVTAGTPAALAVKRALRRLPSSW